VKLLSRALSITTIALFVIVSARLIAHDVRFAAIVALVVLAMLSFEASFISWPTAAEPVSASRKPSGGVGNPAIASRSRSMAIRVDFAR